MLDNISRLRSLQDPLKEMGENIDDKEVAMTLLASLPEDYKPSITALDAVGEADLSYEKVENVLLNDVDRGKDAKNSAKWIFCSTWEIRQTREITANR